MLRQLGTVRGADNPVQVLGQQYLETCMSFAKYSHQLIIFTNLDAPVLLKVPKLGADAL